MASLKYYNSIIIFMTIIVYLLSLFSFCYSSSQIKSGTHHTLELNQHHYVPNCINSSSTTNPATGKDSETAVFEIFHRKRLCVDDAHGATSSSENILRRDELRVNHIRRKIANTNTNNIHCTDDHSVPVELGYSLGTSDYVVLIGLGTPARKLHLVLDTGSDITWTQCIPCYGNCYKQRDRTFDPQRSTTYSNIPCTDLECPQSDSDFECSKSGTCVYNLLYGDVSYSHGYMAKDKLTLTQNDVFPNFMFGCGHNNTGNFGKTAGVLGLSRGRLSVVSQTKQTYSQYFSYFLPDANSNSPGHLTFGRNINNTENVKFTPLIYDPLNPYFYFIKITSIAVGGKPIRIPRSVFKNEKIFIDSGSLVSRLPNKAYIAMSKEFKRQTNTTRYPITPHYPFDPCFLVPNGTIEFPTITFTFEGGVTVEVDPSGIIFLVDSTLVCLVISRFRTV